MAQFINATSKNPILIHGFLLAIGMIFDASQEKSNEVWILLNDRLQLAKSIYKKCFEVDKSNLSSIQTIKLLNQLMSHIKALESTNVRAIFSEEQDSKLKYYCHNAINFYIEEIKKHEQAIINFLCLDPGLSNTIQDFKLNLMQVGPNARFGRIPLLHVAVRKMGPERLAAILEAGADVNLLSDFPHPKASALQWLTGMYEHYSFGNPTNYYANPEHQLICSEVPILVDEFKGSANNIMYIIAEQLLQYGAYLDFYSACALGNMDVVNQFLLEEPSLIHQLGPDGASALAWAARRGQSAVAQLLISKGHNINQLSQVSFYTCRTPLEECLKGHGNRETLEVLVNAGAWIRKGFVSYCCGKLDLMDYLFSCLDNPSYVITVEDMLAIQRLANYKEHLYIFNNHHINLALVEKEGTSSPFSSPFIFYNNTDPETLRLLIKLGCNVNALANTDDDPAEQMYLRARGLPHYVNITPILNLFYKLRAGKEDRRNVFRCMAILFLNGSSIDPMHSEQAKPMEQLNVADFVYFTLALYEEIKLSESAFPLNKISISNLQKLEDRLQQVVNCLPSAVLKRKALENFQQYIYSQHYLANIWLLTCPPVNFQDTLPVELVFKIISYLTPETLINVSFTSTFMHSIANDQLLFKNKVKTHFYYRQYDPNIFNWREKFKQAYEKEYHPLPKQKRVLFSAIKEGDVAGLKDLEFDDLYLKDSDDSTLLHYAKRIAIAPNQAILNKIYEVALGYYTNGNYVEVKKLAKMDRSILHWAVFCNQSIECISRLIELGCDVDAKMSDSHATPLLVAIYGGRLDIIHMLLSRNVDVNVSRTDNGVTPLFAAVMFNQNEVVEWLLKKTADTNKCLLKGESPLQRAVSLRNIKNVENLLAHSADPNHHLNSTGPLFIAVKNNDLQIARMLLNKGANVNLVDAHGVTPLLIAVKNGHLEMVELLIEKGALVDSSEQLPTLARSTY